VQELQLALLIYGIYGLTFFVMGLVILLESWRLPPSAPQKAIFRTLAIFGFLHGLHEWLEIYFLILARAGEGVVWPVIWVRLALLGGSFLALLMYGGMSYRFARFHVSKLSVFGAVTLPLFAILATVDVLQAYSSAAIPLTKVVESLFRYLLGVPGAALAAIALHASAFKARADARQPVDRYLNITSLGFAVYSFSQLFVAPMSTNLAGLVNSDIFQGYTLIPIPLFRTAAAVVITIGIFYGTRFLEHEHQKIAVAAQKMRLEALEQQEALQRDLLRHIVAAQEEERARIARALHDEMAQILTAFSLDLAALQQVLGKRSKFQANLERLQNLGMQMSQGMQRMGYDLRPAHLDDLGLIAALKFMSEQTYRQSSLRVKFELSGAPRRLEPYLETVLYRIAQEALTNIVRHAHTTQAWVELAFVDAQVRLSIRDQGTGFDPQQSFTSPRGWGLAGMKERVESVSGQMRIESGPDAGTTVSVVVPTVAAQE